MEQIKQVSSSAAAMIDPDESRSSMIQQASLRLQQLFSKDKLVGDYSYSYLFTPNIPFIRQHDTTPPFFGLNDDIPILLAALLGLQHTLAMFAGLTITPMIMAGATGANLDLETTQYLVSTALIVCGLMTAVQVSRLHIPGTRYYVGTGLISVVGTSFEIVPLALAAFENFYRTGFCPSAPDGGRLPCPDGYGAILGTSAVCALFLMLLSFMPPSVLQRVFPSLVTGPTVALVGIPLIKNGITNWAGGSGPCSSRPEDGPFRLCPQVGAPHALPWGSAEFIGLGFTVFVTIILCERFGAPLMKTSAVAIGLLVGCIVAAATGYFDHSAIDEAPVASFIWLKTFKLSVCGELVLPLLALQFVLAMEAMGDITATCDVSRLPVEGESIDSRIQGGLLSDGIEGWVAALCTITPMVIFAQNNSIIALTGCANRKAGYWCCFWLVLMGIFSKFAAALVAIPSAVIGGMTTFLFSAVTVSGLRIIATIKWTRRNRFILTAALAPGLGAAIVPNWFSYVFTYSGPNTALQSFFSAIVLVMETGFTVTALVAVILNLALPEEQSNCDVSDMQDDTRVTRQSLGNDGTLGPV